MSRFFLASGSPRRRSLLEQIGLEFEVIESNADETYNEKTEPDTLVKILSERKAEAVFNKLKNSFDDFAVIGSDTVVVHKNKILGKPENKSEAFNMLKLLQNDCHHVHTGISVIYKNGNDVQTKSISNSTKVFMCSLSDKKIIDYIETGEPMDKAGSYAIQGKGALFIEKIEGDYYTVVGMSLSGLYSLLNNMNIHI